MRTEVFFLYENHEMWITYINFCSLNFPYTGYIEHTRFHMRHAHLTLNHEFFTVAIYNLTRARASMSAENHLSFLFFKGEPCGDTAGAVTTEFGFATISIEEAKKKSPIGTAVKKLDAIGATVSRVTQAKIFG